MTEKYDEIKYASKWWIHEQTIRTFGIFRIARHQYYIYMYNTGAKLTEKYQTKFYFIEN